jgi:glycosyltransferase involved in cell wall biosynthesis
VPQKNLLFIPAYNCQQQLPRVLDQIDSEVFSFVDEVIVIENRSTDGTLSVAKEKLISLTGVSRTLIQNSENYSLGGSIKRAILYAQENAFTHIIVLHGDDQANIHDLIPAFKSGVVAANELVIGARFHKDSTLVGYSTFRILGNRALGAIFSLITWKKIDDLIAGLNVFKVSFFNDQLFLKFPNDLTFDAHVLLEACDKKAKIAFVPVTWREEDQQSNAKIIRQGWTILKLLIRYAILRKKVFKDNQSGRPAEFQYPGEIVYQNLASK